MKYSKLIIFLKLLLALNVAYAQNSIHLYISNPTPAAGEKVTITYNPTGTALEGKGKPEAVFISLGTSDFPIGDIDLLTSGQMYKGTFTVPAYAKALVIKISIDGLTDSNGGKGYVLYVYKNNKPIEGGYAAMADFIYSGFSQSLAKIKANLEETSKLYRREYSLYPDFENQMDESFFSFLTSTKDSVLKAIGRKRLTRLLNSKSEDDLWQAGTFLRKMGRQQSSDSIDNVIRNRYPNDRALRYDLVGAIITEQNLHKKDSLFTVYNSKYKISDITKQIISLQLALSYLKNEDVVNFRRFESDVKDTLALASQLNTLAYRWTNNGIHLQDAAQLSKQPLDLITAKINGGAGGVFTSPKQAKAANQYLYHSYADTYAFILYKQGKPDEALTYIKAVYDCNASPEIDVIEHYALILHAKRQYAEALKILEASLKAGASSDVLKVELQKNYIKIKGSDKGYGQYLASLEKSTQNGLLVALAKEMISKPAPNFTLKDINGKSVSLSDFKGKVVILDFWATWCVPCKASFPGMQLAVTKFKDDPNVKFLFINTLERNDNFLSGVKEFLAANKYTFDVLVDEKGEDGKLSKVLNAFEVDGIPTKFFIDRSGSIRFKVVGFSGMPEDIVNEVSARIKMADHPANSTL